MSNTPAHTTKQQTKKKFIVSREFSGNQSMKEAFEQLIERQTHSQFEEWLERKAGCRTLPEARTKAADG